MPYLPGTVSPARAPASAQQHPQKGKTGLHFQPYWLSQRQKKLILAWQGWLAEAGCTHFVTFIFNRGEFNLKYAHELMDEFHFNLDRALYGNNFSKLPAEMRNTFVAFAEHLKSNLHFHAAWRCPKSNIKQFELLAPMIWEELISSGQLDIIPFRPDHPRYITKELVFEKSAEQLYISYPLVRRRREK